MPKKPTEKEWIDLWEIVKTKLEKSNEKLYVSTHGHGVPQLHVRLEKYPKYYNPKQRTVFKKTLRKSSHKNKRSKKNEITIVHLL